MNGRMPDILYAAAVLACVVVGIVFLFGRLTEDPTGEVNLQSLDVPIKPNAVAAPSDNNYHNLEHGVSIYFPDDWIQDLQTPGALVRGQSPPDAPRAGVALRLSSLATATTLDQFVDQSIERLAEGVNFKLLDQGRQRINGNDAHWLLYKTGRFNRKLLTYIFVSGDRGFLVTAGADEKDFGRLEPIYRRISGSFYIE